MSKKSCEAAESAGGAFCEWAWAELLQVKKIGKKDSKDILTRRLSYDIVTVVWEHNNNQAEYPLSPCGDRACKCLQFMSSNSTVYARRMGVVIERKMEVGSYAIHFYFGGQNH